MNRALIASLMLAPLVSAGVDMYKDSYVRLFNALPFAEEAIMNTEVVFSFDQDSYVVGPLDVTNWKDFAPDQHRVVIEDNTAASNSLYDQLTTLGASTWTTYIAAGNDVEDWTLLVLHDDFENLPPPGQAMLRVVNLVADQQSACFDVDVNGRSMFDGVTYTSVTEFKRVPADTEILVQVEDNDNNDVFTLTANLPSTSFYTLYIAGQANQGPDSANQVEQNTYLVVENSHPMMWTCNNLCGEGFPAGSAMQSQTALCSCDEMCHAHGDCCADVCSTCTLSTPDCGQVKGDPHFRGLGGEKFDVPGQPGSVYNLLTDFDHQLNAKWAPACRKNRNIIGEMGLTLPNDAGVMHYGEKGLSWNGKKVPAGETSIGDISAFVDKKGVATVDTNRYRFVFLPMHSEKCNAFHVDIKIEAKDHSPLAHGLIGQTMRGVDSKLNARRDAGIVDSEKLTHRVRSNDVLEGTLEDYEVADSDLFGDSFTFNRLGAQLGRDVEITHRERKFRL